ncbi:hypothetical protein CPB83DRAFT_860715 [Crepidotus variabilis]|uniref:Uncharacterized protein n=1 Tax=Crepidotus variabilis TaxID=179855 RepID=A0A9P6E8R3_9AGAR|nr:hypothetical protein CPB83DRAFT_860715 [Crepidotus variabilis]
MSVSLCLRGAQPFRIWAINPVFQRQPLHWSNISFSRPFSTPSYSPPQKRKFKMPPRKKSSTPAEQYLLLPTPPTILPIVDTHTHVASTYDFYRQRYKEGQHTNVYDFVNAMYEGRKVEAIVDVWCEAPVRKMWKEFADAAIDDKAKSKWGGMEYWFALGVHPHDAKKYDDKVDQDILEAMKHPRCVALGEIGLDYHYDNSPREIQQEVFTRQLRHAVELGKPLTIHTREADADTERILKAEVPKNHRIHIHCFTDEPEFAKKLLDHFPNLYIGITGVATYASNLNTANVIRNMISSPSPKTETPESRLAKLRILLETDAPYMVPSTLYEDLPEIKGKKLPVCHSAMIPWTAKFVANVANEGLSSQVQGKTVPGAPGWQPDSFSWDADMVMKVARENAKKMYGI